MKTLHYSIIVILATSLVVSNNHVFADNIVTSYGGLVGWRQTDFKSDHGNYPIWYKITNGTVINTPLDLPSKTLFFMIKAPYDGQLIVQLPRSIIDSKNQGIDQPYFVEVRGTTGLSKINVTETSNEYIRTLKINFTKYASEIEIVGTFFVENHQPMIKNPSKLSSPQKQFKSGISAKDITCKEGLQIIIKAEDNSPICVKSDTAQKLIKRGWAMLSLKNFGYNPGRGPVSLEPKESGQFSSIGPNPFPPSTWNRLVFFIKSNSTAQIHVQYTSEFENTGNVNTGGQFYTGNPHDFIPLNSSQIMISSSPDHVSMIYGTNTTVVYTISTKNTTSGLYWVFLTQICGVMPVAIDVNSSQIAPSDIPVYSQHCPAQFLNAKILGISGGTAEYMLSQELK